MFVSTGEKRGRKPEEIGAYTAGEMGHGEPVAFSRSVTKNREERANEKKKGARKIKKDEIRSRV